jgi:hypothetical protein
MNPPQRRLLCPMALSLLLACGTAVSASAEVHVSGTADKIVLQAKNATIGEVLEAVRSTLKLRAELAGSTSRQFTGAYAGSLRRVLSRLLDGESFIISLAPGGVNIVIFGPGGTVPRAVPARPGAIANADNHPVQGWDPPVPANDANKPVRLAAADDLENHPLQGWDPPPPAPNPAAAQRAVDAATPQADEDDHHPLQGWDPPARPANAATAAAPLADDASQSGHPAAAQDEKNSSVQGWDPPVPMATAGFAVAPAGGGANKPQGDEEEHNPFQGWAAGREMPSSVSASGEPLAVGQPSADRDFSAPGIANGWPGVMPRHGAPVGAGRQ